MDTTSQWITADINISETHREVAMDYAMALGGLAIVENDNFFQVSYPLDENTQLLLENLRNFLIDIDDSANITQDVVNRENWNKNWQAFFKPTPITNDLIVLPEWDDPSGFREKTKVRIRPAMAFGTGTHETTQLCLQILDQQIRGGESVLDVGTGSGILGITALLKGASVVDGLENDPFTEENIHDNLVLNDIKRNFNLQITDTPQLNAPYDLMVVNIIKARLFPILPNYYNAVSAGGKVIVSGLLQTEDDETRKLLAGSPWEIRQTYIKNEWIAYLCEVK